MLDPANANTPAAEYDMCPGADGWTVYDTATGEPARVNGVPQTGLDIQDADELVDALMLLAQQQSRSTSQ